ncbi:F0F1 ATP synthase subunit B family protein [Lichenicoccus roseus]|uniref:ATP synthase subunit b n=1 Tax=Lichenicoccus roseus TaxID=2683649 RepID=A0A5R9JC08_9PROT|nr:ATPase [Lichenicoccus roseus]TLU74519.1 ATPase [Lichenicoccus roseus]
MTLNWWTLGFQTVNVLVLIWLLQRFFWRPVSAMITQRQATIRKSVDDAHAIEAKAAAALATTVTTRAGFEAERQTILADAHKAAEAARASLLDTARTQALALQAAATAAIEAGRQAADAAWSGRAGQLAIGMAGRLATRLEGAAVQALFLDSLVQAIRALPEAVRAGLAVDGVTLDAVSDAPLDDAARAVAVTAIHGAIGAQPEIGFKVDASLIGGLELHAPHLTVANSWRADLARIHDQLPGESQPAPRPKASNAPLPLATVPTAA